MKAACANVARGLRKKPGKMTDADIQALIAATEELERAGAHVVELASQDKQ